MLLASHTTSAPADAPDPLQATSVASTQAKKLAVAEMAKSSPNEQSSQRDSICMSSVLRQYLECDLCVRSVAAVHCIECGLELCNNCDQDMHAAGSSVEQHGRISCEEWQRTTTHTAWTGKSKSTHRYPTATTRVRPQAE